MMVFRKVEGRLRADGTCVGVIYNGFGTDKTDEEWVQHGEDHFNTLERDVRSCRTMRPSRRGTSTRRVSLRRRSGEP
jgi:hypothetical protein